MSSEQNLGAIGDRIDYLLDDLRATADPRVAAHAEELLRLVTELYGAGLARIAEVVGEESPAAMRALLADDLTAGLMAVHGLHPDDLKARIERALESVRPFLYEHGGDVELLDIDDAAGAVLLRLLGSCDGCPSSSVTLRQAVERAIREVAPEISTIDVDEPNRVEPSIPVLLGPKPTVDDCPADVVA